MDPASFDHRHSDGSICFLQQAAVCIQVIDSAIAGLLPLVDNICLVFDFCLRGCLNLCGMFSCSSSCLLDIYGLHASRISNEREKRVTFGSYRAVENKITGTLVKTSQYGQMKFY